MSLGSNRHKFTLFVDEAGDDGVKAYLNPKNDYSSEWFVLGGIVSKESDENDLVKLVNTATGKAGMPLGRDLHFARMNDKKRKIICREFSKGKFRWFSVLSHKDNVRGYRNERAAFTSGSQNYLYNFMLRILLERVTAYCKKYNDLCKVRSNYSDLRVILSDRGGVNSPCIGNYLTILWRQFNCGGTFLNKGLIDFSVFDPKSVSIKPNSELCGLQIADFVVSSVYKCLPQERQKSPKRDYLEGLLERAGVLDGPLYGASLMPLPFDCEKSLIGEKLEVIQYFKTLAASPRLCVPTSELDRLPS